MMRKNKETGIAPQASEGMTRKGFEDDPFAWARQIDRWFDDVRREFDEHWAAWPRFGISPRNGETAREPTIDLQDQGTEFVVTAEMPGVSKDDVEIHATPNSLEIRSETRAQREEKDETYLFRERTYGAFYRSLRLPGAIVPEDVVATMKDGTVEVRLPKQQLAPATKSVAVKVQ